MPSVELCNNIQHKAASTEAMFSPSILPHDNMSYPSLLNQMVSISTLNAFQRNSTEESWSSFRGHLWVLAVGSTLLSHSLGCRHRLGVTLSLFNSAYFSHVKKYHSHKIWRNSILEGILVN